jgi:conjugative relaxase-like TrwC/TraI family protein
MVVERRLDPVGGFDFVFSAPKSVSLAAMLAAPAVRREVVAAHQAAVHATLGLLEREACGVRLGSGGKQRARGSGIVAALYVHRTSRARDPQLHTHCAIANLTEGLDGAWRALDSRLLLRDWKLSLGYAYQAALRREITARLGWTWHQPVKGLAELDAWPTGVLREFSQRRVRIEAALAEHGASGWQTGQIATLATREAKSATPPSLEDEREGWRSRAAEHGLTHDGLAALLESAGDRWREPETAELVRIAERLAGPEGLMERQNTFRRADVLRAFAAEIRGGTTVEHLEALTDWFVATSSLCVQLADELPARCGADGSASRAAPATRRSR